jgi:transposase
LKSTLEVAPIWLKKNTRIEALMFLEFVAQMLAALVERALHRTEGRSTLLAAGRPKTPTIEQVLRLFEHQNKYALYNRERLIKQFADPLTPMQSQILQLLSISTAAYGPGN